MNSNLNNIEKSLITEIIKEHIIKFPFLNNHYKELYVRNRENTGVGFYINFLYKNEMESTDLNTTISTKKSLLIKGFKNEVNYELDITSGKINFLEIVSNGADIFDKNIDEYIFELKELR